MNTRTILPLLTVFFVSCGDKEQDTEPAQPVVQPPTTVTRKPAPLPVPDTDPTAVFLTPKQDRNLPSSEQLAEGSDSLIGIGNLAPIVSSNQPSTTITPPSIPSATAPVQEDDLAPAE